MEYDYESCLRKTDKYLKRENDTQPLLIDVQNWQDAEKLISHYAVGNVKTITVSNYCKKDEFPRLENFFADIKQCETTCIITELSSFLRLLGEQEMNNKLNELLNMNSNEHVIVITYQCVNYLHIRNKHIQSHVISLKGEKSSTPKLYFCASDLPLPNNIVQVNGLEHIASLVRQSATDKVYIHTSKTKEDYKNALYNIVDIRNAYDILVMKDEKTKNLSEAFGTEEQWKYALEQMNTYNNWYAFIDDKIGDPNRLDIYVRELSYLSQDKESQDKKWLYFIGLKLYGAKNNVCLDEAVKKASSPNILLRNLYCDILQKNVNEQDFWPFYKSRKSLLCQLKRLTNATSELARFCGLIKSKGSNAIYYLTDESAIEKKTLFSCLDEYGEKYNRQKLLVILQKIYPALYEYLQPYDFNNQLLNNYFQDYKYQKVINRVWTNFYKTVLTQAKKRDYNSILEPRSVNIEKLAGPKSKLYFVDAMGVEYLSYIKAICKRRPLSLNIKVCRAELPTITCKNKEFVTEWKKHDWPNIAIKELDDIKHHGKEEFDYYHHSKLPIHLIRELEIISNVITTIQNELENGNIDKAVIIADHGASRLAVLYDKENVWEMAQKGEHSGRCCPKSDVDEQPDCAVDADDFWALANYDRFKGGRKANVEVHGGATLEEICVPIISIQRKNKEITVIIKPIDGGDFKGTPKIKISFRQKAVIKIFVSEELSNIHVIVHGEHLSDNGYYDAVKIRDELNCYRVDMPGIRKKGTYNLNIYAGDNLIAENRSLIVQKEGQQERKLL